MDQTIVDFINKLSNLAPEIYKALLTQVRNIINLNIVCAVVMFICLTITIVIMIKTQKKINEDDYLELSDYPFMIVGYVIVPFVILAFVLTTVDIVLMSSNPDYYAIKLLLSMVQN